MQTSPQTASATEFEELYASMIAGSSPLHSGDVNESILRLATHALDATSVHILIQHNPDTRRAYYFALPSKDLRSISYPATPLAAAIPGHPDHQGDGAYILHADPRSAVAIYMGGDLRFLTNETEVINEYLEEIEVPVFDVSGFKPWRLESDRVRFGELSGKISRRAIQWSVGIIVVGIAMSLGMQIGGGMLVKHAQARITEHEASLKSSASQLEVGSPLNRVVWRATEIMAIANKGDGWIESLQIKNGKETVEITSPEKGVDLIIKEYGPAEVSKTGEGDYRTIHVTKATKVAGSNTVNVNDPDEVVDPKAASKAKAAAPAAPVASTDKKG